MKTAKNIAFKLISTLSFCTILLVARSQQTRQSEDYMSIIRKTADSLTSLKPLANANGYYFLVSKSIYDRAIFITKRELQLQAKSTNAKLVQEVLDVLVGLNKSLVSSNISKANTANPPLFVQTVKASLGNFTRYKKPEKLDRLGEYRWTMLQVFENLNQINVGYQVTGLPSEIKQQCWQRILIHQKMTNRHK
ncbi:hypothetical protein [Mucilaginibacter pedocola]|uniref:DUF4142 domain-containing protein n=1 Tax=Mucilaginibacter pedocola TaxID=1792845 RepID=A0A1S9P8P7_9SPHI|nr:hypothetical protein [Mucilaginibacter pedocola]OOQ57343.1 hypothetical protein BC343_14655 [Mucilaginibacter pedocola]